MTLKLRRITALNYDDEVRHLRFVASKQESREDSIACKKAATTLENFFTKPLSEFNTSGADRIGISFVNRCLLLYNDSERNDEWKEWMLIADDGNHYEVNEVSGHGRTTLPLMTQDEIMKRAVEAREIYGGDSRQCDEW